MNKVEPALPEIATSRSMPGVSVVIPAYNYERYVKQAIHSALHQKYPLLEVIVVDDGSTDNTAELVGELGKADPRVRYIRQKNAGLPAARNTGIRAAKFDYIGFLDADDQWSPEFLQTAMKTFARLPEEFAMVTCRSIVVDAQGEPVRRKLFTPDEAVEISVRDILLKTRFSPSAVVAKTSALKECGYFDETLRSSEDRDMWVRIAARHRVMHNPDRLILFRKHTGSMSTHTDRMKENTRKVFKKAYQSRVMSRFNCFWLQVLSFQYFQTAWMYHGEGRRWSAFADLLFSILFWPVFLKPNRLNEPSFFRLRTFALFLRGLDRGVGRNQVGKLKSASL
jgi:glycosyltransferase involved in cell wall biosynthesis